MLGSISSRIGPNPPKQTFQIYIFPENIPWKLALRAGQAGSCPLSPPRSCGGLGLVSIYDFDLLISGSDEIDFVLTLLSKSASGLLISSSECLRCLNTKLLCLIPILKFLTRLLTCIVRKEMDTGSS